MAGWFSGFGNMGSGDASCVVPTAGQGPVENISAEDAPRKRQCGPSVRISTPAANVVDDGLAVPLDEVIPVNKNISADIREALQRTNAMCKALVQSVEASTEHRINEMEKVLKHTVDDLRTTKNLVEQNKTIIEQNKKTIQANRDHIMANAEKIKDSAEEASKAVRESVRKSTGAEDILVAGTPRLSARSGSDAAPAQQAQVLVPAANINDGALSLLKDDVQTIIDNMRLELQIQRKTIASLTKQVNQLNNGGSASAPFDWDGTGGGGRGGGTSQEQIDKLQFDFNEEIKSLKMSTGLGSTGGTGVTKYDFEQLSAEVGLQLKRMNMELINLKEHQELTAVKAGFLAVAATECNHDEKDHLFQTLKAQEEEYFRKTNLNRAIKNDLG